MRKYNIAQISFLIACGSVLQLAEGLISLPVPGVRIGLANISSIVALILFGAPAAFEVALFRPVITGLTNGTFLSPGFMLSLFGSVGSVAVMAPVFAVLGRSGKRTIVIVSITGAVVHNLTELAVAYVWLIPHIGVLALAPFLLIPAVVGGYLVGWSANYVLDRIAAIKLDELLRMADREEAPPAAVAATLALRDKMKMAVAFFMILSTVFLSSLKAYAFLTLAVVVLIVCYRQTVSMHVGRLFRLWGVIAFSFLLPVVFSPAGPVLWKWHWLQITEPGIYQGGLFALRLIFLICISIWIGVGEPSKLSQELAWILSPLKYFRFSVDRIPRLTSLSLSFIPVIWERVARVKPKTLRSILDVMAAFFVGLEQPGAGAPAGTGSAAVPAADRAAPPAPGSGL
jgi:heptaprenyl diphosphate synthase